MRTDGQRRGPTDLLEQRQRHQERLVARGRRLLAAEGTGCDPVRALAVDALVSVTAERLLLHPVVDAHVADATFLLSARRWHHAALEETIVAAGSTHCEAVPPARRQALVTAIVRDAGHEQRLLHRPLRTAVCTGALLAAPRQHAALLATLPTRLRCSGIDVLAHGPGLLDTIATLAADLAAPVDRALRLAATG